MSRKLFLILFVILILIIASGVAAFLFFRSPQTQTSTALVSETKTGQTKEVKFTFVSNIPELKIKNDTVNEELIKNILQKLGLSSFESIPYIGEPQGNGQWKLSPRGISPQEVNITLYPQSTFDSNPTLATGKIFVLTGATNKPIITYIAGHLDDKNRFNLPIYIDIDQYKNFVNPPDVQLTRDIFIGIFLNFQTPPSSTNPYKEFHDKVGDINGTLFELEKTLSSNILKIVFHIFLPKEIHAQQCSGNPTCGSNTSQQLCSGDGATPCQFNSDCTSGPNPPGGTCQIYAQCVSNGSTGICFCSGGDCGGAGAGFICLHSCPCMFAGGCTKNVIPPPPFCGNGVCGGTETCSSCSADCGACPGGTWGPCGGCDCGHGTECQRDPGGACVWNPGTCSSSWTGCIPQCNPGQAGIGAGAGHCGGNPAQSCPYDGYDCGFGQGNCVGSQSCCNGLVKDGSGNCQCPPPPTCTITLTPDPAVTTAGGQTSMSVTVNSITNGPLTQINFISSNGVVATVTPSDGAAPYITTATGVAVGQVTITADGMVGGQRVCSDNAILNVLPPRGWWQVRDADIISNGSVTSLIPTTCTLPGCNPIFDLDGTGTFPGVIMAGGSTDFSAGVGNGTVSSKNWQANTTYQGKTYNYDYFENLIPTDITFNPVSGSVNGGTFASGGTQSRGFVWYKATGDLTINSQVNLNGSRKVILLVDGGNLNIQGNINIQAKGQGFFSAIVSGNINIDPSVTHPNQPALEGIFMADGQINTGAGSNKLYARGSYVGWGGVNLQRDLGASNATAPAEYFEYAPELVFTFPSSLTRNRIVWREVAP